MSVRELQYRVGKQSVLSGILAMTAGLIYGTQVSSGAVGHPILSLAVHVQLIQNGMFILLGGLLLLTPRACVANNALMLRVVNLVHNFVVLLLYGSEIWGAYNGIYFPSHLAKAGLPAAPAHSYNVFLAMHYGPGLALIVVWVYLCAAVYTTDTPTLLPHEKKE